MIFIDILLLSYFHIVVLPPFTKESSTHCFLLLRHAHAFVRGTEPQQRLHAKLRKGAALDRVLQNLTMEKSLDFLGLGSSEELGGDGTIGEESLALRGGGLGRG